VPLAEAWRSWAKRWNSSTRKPYANDLGDFRILVAVSAHANRSKGDGDPAHWMPTYGKCTYVRQWVAVKLRWRLKINPSVDGIQVGLSELDFFEELSTSEDIEVLGFYMRSSRTHAVSSPGRRM
jgi:hypothetical protein